MPISQARRIAFDVLLSVANQNAYADDLLRAKLDDAVKPEDAGLATELTLGVLRWQRLLDFLIDRHLKRRANTQDLEVRIALRLGAYQLLFLDRVPPRAAVHESVELVKRARKRSAATLVNAVLRRMTKEQFPRNPPPEFVAAILPGSLPLAGRIGIQYSHPTWLVERWMRTYGEERARSLLQSNNRVPAVSGYWFEPQRSEEAIASLQAAGSRVQPGRLLQQAFILEGGIPSSSEVVRKGWVALQDEASQAVAHLVAANPGGRVLDLCAAPGGKTLLLARAVGPQGHVVAADLHEHRVRGMKERFEQAGVRNVETIVLDATKPLPFERPFDRILVDVPCSGTGTLARHPEIRWKLRPEDLADLHDRQAALLRNSLSVLAPGGRLVYSTCSLEPEENEMVVREFLSATSGAIHIANPRNVLKTILQESVRLDSVVDGEGYFRTFPPEHGTDGFFAAVMER